MKKITAAIGLFLITAIAAGFSLIPNYNLDKSGGGGPPEIQTPTIYAGANGPTALAAGDTLMITGDFYVERIIGDSAAITSTATPFIAAPANAGTCVMLEGTDEDLTVTIDDEDTTAGTGLQLNSGNSFTFGKYDNMFLCYDGAYWVERTRKDVHSLLTFRMSPESSVEDVDMASRLKAFEFGGVQLDPLFYYRGQDADSGSWADSAGVGDTLTLSGSGSDPSEHVKEVPFIGQEAVEFNDGKVFEASTTTAGHVTDGRDFVMEIELEIEDVAASQRVIYSTYDSGSNHMFIYQNTSSIIAQISGIGLIRCLNATATNQTHYILHWWGDRSGNSYCVANGIAGAAVDISAAPTAQNSIPMVIGGLDSSSTQASDHTIISIGLWQCPSGSPGCLGTSSGDTTPANGTDDWIDKSRERMFKALNVWPTIGDSNLYVSDSTRTSGAYFGAPDGLGERQLYFAGPGWPRVEWNQDHDFYSLLVEPGSTNLNTYSEEINQAAYTKTRSTVSTNGCATAAPDGTMTAEKVTHSFTSNESYIAKAHTFSNSTYEGAFSVFILPINADFFRLYLAGGSGGYCDFQASTMTPGSCTVYGAETLELNLEQYKDGWIRASLTTGNVAATAVYSRLYSAEADTDVNWSYGPGETHCVWGWQVEQDVERSSSYIYTSSSSAARQTELISMTLSSGTFLNATHGTVYTEHFLPNIAYADIPTERYVYVFDDTGSAEYMKFSNIYTSPGNPRLYASAALQWNITGINDYTGGLSNLRVKYQDGNDADFRFNGSSAGTDNSFTTMSNPDKLYLGSTYSGDQPMNGNLAELQIYSDYTEEVK